MRIHAIQTGHVRIRERMKRGVSGPLRRAALITGPWTGPLPILAWAIEHDEGVIVVDTGERADSPDAPYVRFEVAVEEEMGPSLEALGIDSADVKTVVLTHLHGDHMNGLGFFPSARVVVSAAEARYAATPIARVTQRVTHQPLPPGFDPAAVSFDGPALGAFSASHPLTESGDVVLVPTPGHTPGHSSVIVVDEDRHVFIAGDVSYDQDQLLDLHVDAVSAKASVSRKTMETVLRHTGMQPTVYLPTHDPESAARLAAGTVLRARGAEPPA